MSLRHLRPGVLALAGLALLGAVVMVADEAEATHFWSGSLSWERVLPSEASDLIGTDAAVRITGYLSFDSTPGQFSSAGPGCAKVTGTFIASDKANFANLYVGGVPIEYAMRVAYVDPIASLPGHCRFAAQIVDPAQGGTAAGVLVPIPPAGPPIEVWWGKPEVGVQFCCRENGAHVNNPNQPIAMGTVLVPGDPNSSPVIDFPSITTLTSHGSKGYGNHHCPLNSYCKFFIKASDADNDTLTWRLATTDEAGSPAFKHPPNFDIDAQTGLVTWLTSSPVAKDRLYSTQIIVEDGTTKVPVDFMVEIGPGCENGATGVVDPYTGELICVFDEEEPEPEEPCEVNPDDDGCRPVPPRPSNGKPYQHKFWPPGQRYVPLAPAVSDSEHTALSEHDDVVGSLSSMDADGDSISDSDDLCPGSDTPENGDVDGDGIGDGCDTDADGDGILNEMDACPRDADPACEVEQEGKEGKDGRDAAQGFFTDADAAAPGSGQVAVHEETSRVGGYEAPLVLGLVGAFLLLLVVATRRRPQD